MAGQHVPVDDLLSRHKAPVFAGGDKGLGIIRHVGTEIEFHDFKSTPDEEESDAFKKLVTGMDGEIDEDHANMEIRLSPAMGTTYGNRVDKVCESLKTLGVVFTTNSGIHIHVDARDLEPREVARVMSAYAFAEPWLIQTQPYQRISSKFCRPIGVTNAYGWGHAKRHSGSLENEVKSKAMQVFRGVGEYRYRAVNFASWYKYKTIEVRCHEGVSDADLLKRWAALWTHFVEATKDIKTSRSKALCDLSTISSIVGAQGSSYLDERLKKYKDEWSPEKVTNLIPKMNGMCEKCRIHRSGGYCCGLMMCQICLKKH